MTEQHWLPVTEPFPWTAMLNYLRSRTVPGMERIEQSVYVREGVCTISLDANGLCVTASADNMAASLAAAQRLFRPDLETRSIDALLGSDPVLQQSVQTTPGLRQTGVWNRFELCLRVIIGQQVTVAAARTLLLRVLERTGGSLCPQALLSADTSKLGMPQARVDTLLRVAGLAHACDFDALPWPEVRAQLAACKGIGPWTLGYLDLQAGLLPDVFPAADVGLQIAANERNAKALAQLAERWAPWRSFAAVRLWLSLGNV